MTGLLGGGTAGGVAGQPQGWLLWSGGEVGNPQESAGRRGKLKEAWDWLLARVSLS